MHRLNRRQSLTMLASALASASWGTQAQTPTPPPPLQLVLREAPPDASLPVSLMQLEVQAEVIGSVARTQVELVFFNPNRRTLEGELKFPLLEGQAVSGFALDVQGQLRNAVPVAKEQGRQVFEDISRERVDPALLQTTQGNNYSLRVYPIPAGGTRRVRLEITQVMTLERDALVYRMPLGLTGAVGRLQLTVKVVGVTDARKITAALGARSLTVTQPGGTDTVVAAYTQENAVNPGLLILRQAGPVMSLISAAEFRGKTYFYAELPPDPRLQPQPRPRPRRLGLVWDASGSTGASRSQDHLSLLDLYFAQLRDTEVLLRVVRDVADPVQSFPVRNGDWVALRQYLLSLVHDGATDNALWTAAPEAADLVLVFTDGLVNYGQRTTPPAQRPTLVMNVSASANTPALRHWAERSGGEYIDLSATPLPAALQQMTQQRPRISGLAGQSVSELVAHSPYMVNGRYRVAGVLTAPLGELNVTLTDAMGHQHSSRWSVRADASLRSGGLPVAPYQWATLQLNALMDDEVVNARAIERLGMQFRLATARTSLIVLDTAQDYARHGIEPPADEPVLAREVGQLRAREAERDHQIRQRHLDQVTRQFQARQAWWNKAYPTEPKPAPPAGSSSAAAAAAEAARDRVLSESTARLSALAMAAAPAAAVAARPAPPTASMPSEQRSASIRLKRWQPDSPYARRMRAAEGDAVYRVYLDERPSHTDSTAFYLDAADILLQKRQPALAARVLSNLAEMDLESRYVLRILAYRLMQMNATGIALPLLERVLALAPDEPQSWRDLALAEATLSRHQAAVDHLWHVVSNPWHGRFPGIEMTALGELNAVLDEASRGPHTVDTQNIPSALLRHLPVGMRVTLAWDADNTDIDLHVIDPHGEEASFRNRLTHQGGAMSPDFTGGYGPEEFILKNPVPGKYKVRANFYGHAQQVVSPYTTLVVQMFTGFGTPAQKMEQVVLRLSGRKDIVEVGEFEILATGTR